VRAAVDWLLTPDDFEGDPTGFALNQIGHIALGAALAWLAGPIPVLVGYLAWEMLHLWRGGSLWDGIEDYGFVAAGVLSLALWPWAWAVAAPFLASGTLRRAG
jgi:hypothetical protein